MVDVPFGDDGAPAPDGRGTGSVAAVADRTCGTDGCEECRHRTDAAFFRRFRRHGGKSLAGTVVSRRSYGQRRC